MNHQPSDPRFADLIRAVQDGSDEAAGELVATYADVMRREVRFNFLDTRLRRVVSESDVCQSVMAQLFMGLWSRQIEFESAEKFQGLLKKMVRARVIDAVRKYSSDRRNLARDVSLGEHGGQLLYAGGLDPSETCSHAELIERFQDSLSLKEKQILEFRRNGFTWEEVAERLGGGATSEAIRKQYERAVRRVMEEQEIDEVRSDQS